MFDPSQMIAPTAALPGRVRPIATAAKHAVFGRALSRDIPPGMEIILLGMGCFWGAERLFWQQPGVWMTMVGYGGGFTPNPTYEETCTGRTGHTELVRVTYDPAQISAEALMQLFWENHDPTQGMAQGNDRGSQYRSALFYHSAAQGALARQSAAAYGARLAAAGLGPITTQIGPSPEFFHAEAYHQQYLHKNPDGYCGIGGTGVSCRGGAL